jgi:hypothetical protein
MTEPPMDYLTTIATAFDPVEGAVQFEPDTWARIRQAIFDAKSERDGLQKVLVQCRVALIEALLK